MISEIPILDETLCTGCGDCARICPSSCLEMSGLLPWLPRPNECVSCAICVVLCPVDALRMESEEAD
jgi:formate hydrogenlyase subunit 6/NADH:ubiquinone oxidoreductase subunit I